MKPSERFSNRVADYVNYRPRYPEALVPLLVDACGLTPEHRIADIGSGTGFLAALFLRNGNRVFAIEPNGPMREAAEACCGGFEQFQSVRGSAEATGLSGGSIDLVTVGQAFHWFQPEATRREFKRILRPGGRVVLVWNERRADASGFLADYDALLHRHGTDYAAVDHRQFDAARIAEFFDGGKVEKAQLANAQVFDHEGLAGRVRSCSYVPAEGEPGFAPMMADVEALFGRYQVEGRVTMDYDTIVFMGQFQ